MNPRTLFPSDAIRPDVRAFYPGIVTARFHETWDFYTEQLGFRTVSEWDTTVQLEHPSGAQLSLLQEETDGNPAELVSATDGRGFWINLEVNDAELEYDRLVAAGMPVASDLEERRGGERRFAVRDPNGILIFVTQRTGCQAEPDLELAEIL